MPLVLYSAGLDNITEHAILIDPCCIWDSSQRGQ